MKYRSFGKTGFKVSKLGFGAMRLPIRWDGSCDYNKSVPIIKLGIDRGINYIDTAHGYIRGTSEVAVGKAIKGYDRSKLFISTKIVQSSSDNVTRFRRRLEESLKRLDTYIDVLHVHGLTWDDFNDYVKGPNGTLEQVRKAQDEGLVKHLAFSSHDSAESIEKLIDTGEFESLTLQYNLLDRHNEEVIALARERGMGVAIMGPLAGGNLGSIRVPGLSESKKMSNIRLGLRFVMLNPNVDVTLSGMNAIGQVEENCAIVSEDDSFTEEENKEIERMVNENKKLADTYCTGCGYCMPCPNGVNIPENFRYYIWYKVWGAEKQAKDAYRKLTPAGRDAPWGARGQWGRVYGKAAYLCVECGACEPKCPQKIPIIKQLKEVAKTLA